MIFLAIPTTAKTKKVRDISALSCLRIGYTASKFVTTCYIYITYNRFIAKQIDIMVLNEASLSEHKQRSLGIWYLPICTLYLFLCIHVHVHHSAYSFTHVIISCVLLLHPQTNTTLRNRMNEKQA